MHRLGDFVELPFMGRDKPRAHAVVDEHAHELVGREHERHGGEFLQGKGSRQRDGRHDARDAISDLGDRYPTRAAKAGVGRAELPKPALKPLLNVGRNALDHLRRLRESHLGPRLNLRHG